MHWHAYTWTGAGADRGNEAERRTTSPDFTSSALPPMRTGDWLAKPAARIAATVDDVREAAEWLAAEYGKIRAALRSPERILLDDRLATALELLSGGVDVQWGEWLQDGRFSSIAMICCPNKHVSHRCPAGRLAQAGAR
ncbi:hypothetical protein BKM31_32645 [[Actinomadura] parvosata subsp. kistnae]|uniref:Uncharacterized protein n=1 Tax=[Actinomadura] parvosata subsp. kistnae TaxID=1909395 RepID=A0A1V0A5U1_9ACTN|nr:hypothetical protein [Nonomuraea sp. ATCC 55076]AQZ65578.1 hypothetical protein BKM31_32645 [Nonomuraea sp. ATCC 55076]